MNLGWPESIFYQNEKILAQAESNQIKNIIKRFWTSLANLGLMFYRKLVM